MGIFVPQGASLIAVGYEPMKRKASITDAGDFPALFAGRFHVQTWKLVSAFEFDSRAQADAFLNEATRHVA